MLFKSSDLDEFSKASRDLNPLHGSRGYARRTPFGAPIAHGMLVAIESFRHLGLSNKRLLELHADFRQPVYEEIDYQVSVERGAGGEVKTSVTDGGQIILGLRMRYAENKAEPECSFDSSSEARDEARVIGFHELQGIKGFQADYSPSNDYIMKLLQDESFKGSGASPLHIAVIMGCSYVVGMEMPGREALLRSASIHFADDFPGGNGALRLSVDVEKIDERFGLIELAVDFRFMELQVAKARIKTFLRPMPASGKKNASSSFKASEELKGKVALVIGGSRGLGAQTVQALAMRGATVYASYLYCGQEAESLLSSLAGASGRLILKQGDGSDEGWCRSLEEEISKEHGKLDILVCNACPPIRSIRLNGETISRVNEYVDTSLRLITVPIGTFLDSLRRGAGACVLISSQALENYPLEWPHYVAAKAGAEAMLEVLAKQNAGVSFIKVRPPKILTDQVNTNLGQYDSKDPARVAAAIADKMAEVFSRQRQSSSVELLRDFD